MNSAFYFRPIHFNWVAINPQPIGVINFIGGAFFGTFPTLFYRYLLSQLFKQGYTIVALPFRFTLRHWSVAIGLVRDQRELRQEILAEAKRLGYEYKIYEEEPRSEKPNYFWLAHSVGCKYIALLELLSDLESKSIREVLGNCVGKDQYREIEERLKGTELKDISLRNQPSLLLAPAIEGIESAIPIPALAELAKQIGFDVKPTVKQTHCLIEGSRLFNLTALIAFEDDKIAEPTVTWLRSHLHNALVKFSLLPKRSHLAPLGRHFGDRQLVDDAIQSLQALTQKLAAGMHTPN
jgi:hypothetical protein